MSDYTIDQQATQCRVVLAGDLTASIVPNLQGALKAALAKGVAELTFDFKSTVMLDSSGIGLLIAAYNSLLRTAGRVCVQNASPEIMQLLQSMRLTSRLNVTGSQTT